jgi:hypothetical protein
MESKQGGGSSNVGPLQQPGMDNMVTILSNEENVLAKQIQATHSPDGRVIDNGPLLYYVEGILNRASTLNPDAHALITTV